MSCLTDPDFWSIVSSISTILGFGVVIYATIVALGQLREMAKTRHLEAMLHVYEVIGSDEARSNRRFIYAELKSKPEEITMEERDIIEKVSVTLDRIGIMVESGLIPRNELLEGHCEVFIKTWDRLEPYIRHLRQIAGRRWVHGFQWLAEISREYHSGHFPQEPVTVSDAPSSTAAPPAPGSA